MTKVAAVGTEDAGGLGLRWSYSKYWALDFAIGVLIREETATT